MYKIFALVVFVGISFNTTCVGQSKVDSYYVIINESLMEYADSNYDDAYKLFKKALNKFNAFEGRYAWGVTRAISRNDIRLAKKYTKKAIGLGHQFGMFDDDSLRFPNFRHDGFQKWFEQSYPKLRGDYLSLRTDSIKAYHIAIKEMAELDQWVRANKHNAKDTSTWKYTDSVDSTNFFRFKELIKNGIPDRKLIDQACEYDLWLLIIHFRTLSLVTSIEESEMNWLDSIYLDQIKLMNWHATTFVQAYDRYYAYKSYLENGYKMQFYGSFNNHTSFMEIDDIFSVDERLNALYLLPLNYSAKFKNLPLPKTYSPTIN